MFKPFNRDIGLYAAFRRRLSTVTAASGAATLNTETGIVTSESLTTAAAAVYTLTLTNNKITANTLVNVVLGNGSNSQGVPVLNTITPAAGSVVIKVSNEHATQALNGTLKFYFELVQLNLT